MVTLHDMHLKVLLMKVEVCRFDLLHQDILIRQLVLAQVELTDHEEQKYLHLMLEEAASYKRVVRDTLNLIESQLKNSPKGAALLEELKKRTE